MGALRAIVVALLLWWPLAAAADVAVPPLTGRIVDQTSTLSSGDIAALDQKLRDFEERKGTQIAVLIVPTTSPETIEQFSLRVAEAWKIGRKKIDDGAILVVAKDDRTLRIEVGYGLEGALNDVTAKRIIDEIIVPKFRSGDFAGGVDAGVDRILRVVDGEPLPAPQSRQAASGDDLSELLFNPVTLIGVLFLGGILRATLGRLFGSVATGGVVAIVAWFLVGTLFVSLLLGLIAAVFTLISDVFASPGGGIGPGGIGRGGWSGGRGGGFSGGSGSSGGFSGGGGSFGGGGASGRW